MKSNSVRIKMPFLDMKIAALSNKIQVWVLGAWSIAFQALNVSKRFYKRFCDLLFTRAFEQLSSESIFLYDLLKYEKLLKF
jgi:hypothetical protein